ncbi:MAG TPA: hypothetical protein VKA83_09210 [Methylomirabilota bacterium]|nr:hypothetical protein [Methylomirabilota bacterium]
MSTYILNVVRHDPDPAYEEKLAAYREGQERVRNGYRQSYDVPSEPARVISTGTLAIELTEEQWQAVKQAVLETWK